MPKSYCAVIGDINKSRDLPDRRNVQRRFQKSIAVINKEFRDDIASRFLITLGDECQGLLHSPACSYRLVQRFLELMDPVPLSFGVGIGSLSTRLRPEALGMDGEAFHRARAALRKAKKLKRSLVLDLSHPLVPLANALIGFMDIQRARVTPRQYRILKLMKKHNNQAKAARVLRISQQAVAKTLSSVGYREMHDAEDAVQAFLSTTS